MVIFHSYVNVYQRVKPSDRKSPKRGYPIWKLDMNQFSKWDDPPSNRYILLAKHWGFNVGMSMSTTKNCDVTNKHGEWNSTRWQGQNHPSWPMALALSGDGRHLWSLRWKLWCGRYHPLWGVLGGIPLDRWIAGIKAKTLHFHPFSRKAWVIGG